MTRLERGFIIRVTRLLQKAANDGAEAVETYGQSASIPAALRWFSDEMQAVLISQYEVTVELFGNRILDAFKSHAKYEKKADEIFKDNMELWIRKTAAEKVVGIERTTINNIRKVIDDGFAESATANEVSKSIVEKTGGLIAKQRATVIAKTETHMAANHATMESMRSTNIPAKKIWIAAADERTRETHMMVDAESHANPLALNENFQVGTDSMDAPSQGSDPAENINCRCAVAFVTD